MVTKPISVRFSETLTRLIQGISDKDQKTPSDFIREAVEEKAYGKDGYRSQLVPLLMSPKDTLSHIRDKLDQQAKGEPSDPISRHELSALMIFWHQAYQMGDGYANPLYVMTLLDITEDLLTEAKKQQIDIRLDYCHSKLDIQPDESSYKAAFADLKKRYLEVSTISWAETLARPVSVIANHLDQFSGSSIAKIFTGFRIQELLPVAVKGIKADLSDRLISLDMKQLLPDAKSFEIGGIKVSLFAEPFCMVVEGEHHLYKFKTESLMSLMLFSETDQPMNQSVLGAGLKRNTVEVLLSQGNAVIHEYGGYRLSMPEADFMELRNRLKEIAKNRHWNWLLKRFRSLKGDV